MLLLSAFHNIVVSKPSARIVGHYRKQGTKCSAIYRSTAAHFFWFLSSRLVCGGLLKVGLRCKRSNRPMAVPLTRTHQAVVAPETSSKSKLFPQTAELSDEVWLS